MFGLLNLKELSKGVKMIYKGKEIKSNYKYLEFQIDHTSVDDTHETKNKKTIIIDILNNSCGHELGYIKWYPQWRQYCMFTYDDIVFNSQCLKDIAEFMDNLMRIHKEAKS